MLNHFSIMQQRRLRDQDEEEEEKDKGRKAPGKGGGLRIHDLEEDLELSSEESEGSEAEGERENPQNPTESFSKRPQILLTSLQNPPRSTQNICFEKSEARAEEGSPKIYLKLHPSPP